ncbi:MAG: hypothetical protein ACREKL_00255, partial [Chthoniobacterales bacterium]
SGTVWVSALIKGSGNSGGDAVGIVLQGSTNNLFAGFDGGFSASNTLMGIGTASAGTVWNDTVSGFASAGNFSNTTTHLIVLELNLTTNSTKLYVDPTAGQSTPPAVPGATLSLAIGTFSGMGFNSINPNGTFDEFRVGTTFGDVVGVAAVPEPHQYALVGALLFAIAFMRRRRMVANIR